MNYLLILISFVLQSTIPAGNENLEFNFIASRDSSSSSLLHIDGKIINKSDKSIFFLSESCNGLDYYLKTKHTDAYIFLAVHCNATYPRKIEIKPQAEYSFSTSIHETESIEILELTLTFVELKPDTKIKGRFIHEIKNEYSNSTIYLKAKSTVF